MGVAPIPLFAPTITLGLVGHIIPEARPLVAQGEGLRHRNGTVPWNEWVEAAAFFAALEGTCTSGDGQDETRDDGGAGCEPQLLRLGRPPEARLRNLGFKFTTWGFESQHGSTLQFDVGGVHQGRGRRRRRRRRRRSASGDCG